MQKTLTIAALVILALTLAGCGLVIDNEGAKFGNPRDFAEATHIAQMSEDAAMATRQAVELEATRTTASIQAQATASAIQHQAQQAEADKAKSGADIARVKAETEQNAQDAAIAGKQALYLLGYTGAGVAALVLLVGLAFGITAWMGRAASTVYPNRQGQFPVIIRKGAGFIAYHDPNRALGPGAVLRTPGLLERAGYALALARGKVQPLQPGAEYPQPGSEAVMLQIATQEQAAQVRIAETANRPKLVMAVDTSPNAARQSSARGRMPNITVVNDPAQIESFERKLLEASDE